MNEQILSGVLWCVYNNIFLLQRRNIVPTYPWDVMSHDEEKSRGYDQGFCGDWLIVEQDFIFRWDVLSNTLPDTPVRQQTILKFLMRGELPMRGDGKPMQSKEAERRWFVDKMRIETPTGKMVGEVQEITVLEAGSRDDVMIWQQARNENIFKYHAMCERKGSNLRPSPYQRDALPLSYARTQSTIYLIDSKK